MAAVKIHSLERAADLAAAAAGTAVAWTGATVQGEIRVGYGQQLGSMQVLEPMGTVDGSTVSWTDREGQWVRVQLQDGSGPVYWFRVNGQTLTTIASNDGPPIEAMLHQCVGVAAVLADRAPTQTKVKQGTEPAELVDEPPTTFNPQMGEGQIRPTHRSDITAGHVMSFDDGANAWLAYDIIQYLAKQWAEENSLSCTVTASSAAQTALTANPQRWELAGMSYLEAIATVANKARGVGFTVTMGSGGIEIDIDVSGAANVTFSGGHASLSQRSGATLDLSSAAAGQYTITRGDATVYDNIIVVGDKLWSSCGLYIDTAVDANSDLKKGWGTAEETDWDNDGLTDETAHVWRRWRIKQGIDNVSSDTTPLPTERVDSDGWNGEIGTSGPLYDMRMASVTDSMPIKVGADYTSATPPTTDADPPYRPNVVLCYDTTNGFRTAPDAIGIELEALPDQDGHGIMLYPESAGADVKDYLESGDDNQIVIGCGIELPISAAVSWRRSSGGIGRTLVAHAPGATVVQLLPLTPLGADAGALVSTGVTSITPIDDGLEALRSVLADLMMQHAYPRFSITATVPGYYDGLSPGDLVTTVTTGAGTSISVQTTVQSITYVPSTNGEPSGYTNIVCGDAPNQARASL
jgi:hypothetical protein